MLLSLKGLESANNFHPSVDKIKKKKNRPRKSCLADIGEHGGARVCSPMSAGSHLDGSPWFCP